MNSKVTVQFYDTVDDDKLKYAVISARYRNKWVFCKHKERNTYEIPGGHREQGETIDEAARRELFEETGALQFNLKPICVYTVENTQDQSKTFGMLYFADITEINPELKNEIEKIELFDDLPTSLTYPLIQPFLFERAKGYFIKKEKIKTTGSTGGLHSPYKGQIQA
ncbi:MAG: NUDIX domain-containing protein [Clostridia bacterium]|nr:NUDIX domain-containing protein [Clostridia bacterium]